ncbi:histone-lysine n-methyltransferase setd2 [Holotrichia oblita]|uniref:Histone-lysine n-methyltransferase setd2 n=1 Tax=Holotrichia oblita TaxID=644536 RepID=A0ACB9TBJ8_HOLOL|nr:histone-lysine n-methyltransferase setd2 [Holotrichia oblita]
MAPRKKRVTKNAAITARTRSGMKYQGGEKDLRKAIAKKSFEAKKNKEPPIIPPPEPVVTRSHKKFGKYRFFTENESLTQSETSTETTTSGEYGLKSIEEVLLPQSELDMENEDEIIISDEDDSTNENSLCEESSFVNEEVETEMESVVTPRDSEEIISEKLSNLNVDCQEQKHADSETGSCEETECVTELGKDNPQVYQIESFESEVFIDCIAEETIPICGEQEIINETEDSNSIKEVICEVIEKTDKTEDLTLILEESRSENEESSQKDETAICELTSILEDDIKDEKIDKKDDIIVEDLKDIAIEEDIIKEEEEEIKDDNDEIKKESPKSKAKPKVSRKKTGKLDKNENSDKSESSVRRSNRIKSINVSRQKSSKGHGLVKQKSDTLINENCDSNSSSVIEPPTSKSTQKNTGGQISHPQDHQKHVKVKSRWRRSSELELNNSTIQNLNKIILPSPVPSETETNSATISDETCHQRDSEEVARRLKQFVHLKENLYLTERISCKEAKKMICDCFLTEEDIEQGEYGCGDDCLNRLLMIECGSLCAVGDRCTNKRFQKGQFAPCEVFRTEKKGLGIRAAANIPYGEFILEYVGEVLDPEEFEKRAAEYSKDKNQHYYFMSLRADAVIDATRKGNVSRFINHSCDPNAETQKWTVNGELRIGFFSKRTILAGEEITFDYQFQRYGSAEIIQPAEASENQEKIDQFEATSVVKQEKPVKKEKKKILRQRLPRKELFEDLDLDDEIETLQTTGLKNQAHTLKLSRLMVRAKEPAQRQKLLRVLRRGELPCRRLFLDYHGLRLIHGWMTDAQHLSRINRKFEFLRLEILQTLATLPIPNKTMLQDSKVLPTVEKWSVKLEDEISPIDSDSNSPKMETESTPKIEGGIKTETADSSLGKNLEQTRTYRENIVVSPVPFENKESKKIPTPPPTLPDLPVDHYETEIIALALKLLEEWAVLKEVFRIPKKERIEQMKEHEREADRKYKAGLGLDGQNSFLEKKDLNRYPFLSKRQRRKRRKNAQADKEAFIDKYERRKMFALQVEQREMERRRSQREFWRQHEQRCVVMGADPRFTAPFEPNQGYQYVWNPQTGQWQNYSLPGGGNPQPNFNPVHQHHQAQPQQYLPPPIGHNPHLNQAMLPNMQQNQPIMKHLPPNLPQHGIVHQKPPVGFNPQPPPLPPNSSQHQYNIRAPPPNLGVPPNMGNMPPNAGPPLNQPQLYQHHMAPQQGQPGLAQQPTAGYHLGMDGQNPPVSQSMVHANMAPLSVNVHSKPPPLPALPYQENIKEQEEVRFMGPIPPPAKLPPKWKCAKDKYGRPYYYHIRFRKPQWEPPELPPPEENEELTETSSSSETSSASSDSSTEETDSDDDIDDAKLLLQIKNKFKQMDALKDSEKSSLELNKQGVGMDEDDSKDDEPKERSLDDRLIEEFCFMKGAGQAKRKRVGLVQEILISPRTEEDRLQFKEDMKRYKQNKEKLKRQKELLLEQSKKHSTPQKPALKSTKSSKKHKITVKTKLKEMVDSEAAKKIKESFRSSMAVVMVSILNTYRKPDCKEGRITNTEDFKHLARKLTHFVMLKELKHCQNIEDLTCTESVKSKAKEFVRKYMSKFGEIYQKPKDEAEFY